MARYDLALAPSSPAVVVASADAPQSVKINADYVCDGTNDQEEINAAITKAAALQSRDGPSNGEQRGKVQLTGGRFNFTSGPILLRTGVELAGMGRLTELRAVNLTGEGLIMLQSANTHLTTVRDMWLYGNFSSGGSTSSAIRYDSSNSQHTQYPASSPDADHYITGLYISGWAGNSNRRGIYLSGTGVRGSIISDIQMRSIGGHGIEFNGASDNHLTNIHMGTIGGTGYLIGTGNTKLVNCKAFYCDGWGFDISSSRCFIAGCESQDNANGIRLSGADGMITGTLIDTSQTTGLSINNSGIMATGIQVIHRSGARYASQTNGIVFSGTPTNVTLIARVGTSGITNRLVGTTSGAGNFIRVTGNNSLTTIG